MITLFCLDYLPNAYGGRHTFRHTMGNAAVDNLEVPEAAVTYKEAHLLDLYRQARFSSARVVGQESEILQCDLVARSKRDRRIWRQARAAVEPRLSRASSKQ